MKALVYHGNRDLRLESVPDPEPGAGDVRLRMDYCGICATDVEEYVYGPKFIFHDEPNPLTGKKTPLITGHEITGTVEKLGAGVSGLSVGDRVVLDTILTCGECWWCRAGRRYQCDRMAVAGFGVDGGLAEYLVWPASHAITLPGHRQQRRGRAGRAGVRRTPCRAAGHDRARPDGRGPRGGYGRHADNAGGEVAGSPRNSRRYTADEPGSGG